MRALASLVIVACVAADADRRQCDDWAATGECESNGQYMTISCQRSCDCHRWAGEGECERNPTWMIGNCAAACSRQEQSPPPPPAISEVNCTKWARVGECENNAAFMFHVCEFVCAQMARRERCDQHACAGTPPPQSVCGRRAPSNAAHTLERNGSWPLAPALHQAVYQQQQHVAVVNDGATTARLYWVDDHGQETGYGVVMPSSRLELQTYIGHHWRVRDLDSQTLLHEAHVMVATARPCMCTHHLVPAKELLGDAASRAPFGFDASKPSALLVENRDAFATRVSLLNRTTGVEHELGTLHPAGSLVANASYQLLVDGVRAGDVLTVRRANRGETIMQHVCGDIIVSPCEANGGSGGDSGSDLGSSLSQSDSGASSGGSTERLSPAAQASKAAALTKRRDEVRAEAETMRRALDHLQSLGSAEGMDEASLRKHLAEATRALASDDARAAAKASLAPPPPPARRGRRATTPPTRRAAQASAQASAQAEPKQRQRSAARSAASSTEQHDELRL